MRYVSRFDYRFRAPTDWKRHSNEAEAAAAYETKN